MLGDFFREAAVLITVFFPLELARKDGNVSLASLLIVASVAILSLLAGIVFERMR